jgi:hypothetical protein
VLYPSSDLLHEVETAIASADALVFAKTGKHFSTLQITIFRGAWFGQKYEEIAQACCISDTHIKMVGADLWKLLSFSLNERVTKKTFRACLERRSQLSNLPHTTELPLASIPDPVKPYQQFATDLELSEGQVKLGSKFYIERAGIEPLCYKTIEEPGALIRIRAPHQMGKTSLMTRILHHAMLQNYHTVSLNLQLVDRKSWQNSDQFLRWFCANVSRELHLPHQLDHYWDDLLGSKMSCRDYFKEYLLQQSEHPIVIALDEADLLFQDAEITQDMFALLRTWHEEAKNQTVWAKLRFVLVHCLGAYLSPHLHQSPLNVGLSIDLPPFLPGQVLDLAHRYGLPWDLAEAEQLMAMIGGQPYLVRVALHHLAHHNMTLNEFLQKAPTETGVYTEHLHRNLWNLEQQPDLAIAFRAIVNAKKPVHLDAPERLKLSSMGLIHHQGTEATPYCELYRHYFRHRL